MGFQADPWWLCDGNSCDGTGMLDDGQVFKVSWFQPLSSDHWDNSWRISPW